MKRNPHLVFMTGGGTAGHIIPNLALAEELKKDGIVCEYLGRPYGMEAGIIKEAGMAFHPMNSGRLHRSFNSDTFLTPFRMIAGVFQGIFHILKYRPGAIFCKGGFMGWPAAVAGWLTYTPVVLHESDLTPGLANRLCAPFANRICTTFPETLKHLPEGKAVYTGTPIRASLTKGSREKGFELTGLDPAGKPVLMVVGGSLGAGALNEAVDQYYDLLRERFQILHLYGTDSHYKVSHREPGYCPIEYAKDELPDLFAMTDLVLSRAGSNAINEFLLLKMPNVLVPLPTENSRGDQILNAEQFEAQGFSYLLRQEDMSAETLMQALDTVYRKRDDYRKAMDVKAKNGTKEVAAVIRKQLKRAERR